MIIAEFLILYYRHQSRPVTFGIKSFNTTDYSIKPFNSYWPKMSQYVYARVHD